MLASPKFDTKRVMCGVASAIVMLVGAGEHVIDTSGRADAGNFGLPVRDDAHSTAPNRCCPYPITQRPVKAALVGARSPYSDAELLSLAKHCSGQDDDAIKVVRQVRKSADALLLATTIGQRFDAVVASAPDKGT